MALSDSRYRGAEDLPEMYRGIKATPTEYRGIQFESKLEATWAAFFDIAGWKWEYEPVLLRGWKPDFILYGEKGPIYVEVKPIRYFDQETADRMANAEKKHELLLLGVNPYQKPAPDTEGYSGCRLGWLCEDNEFNRKDEALVVKLVDSGKLDFIHCWEDYTARMSGIHDGDRHFECLEKRNIQPIWKEAVFRVEFKILQDD